jgi:opacity protein-like surface antigen
MHHLVPLACLLVSSCAALKENESWQASVGADVSIFDDYELEVESTLAVDVDYSALQIELGATRIAESEGERIKQEFAGIRVGFGDIELGGVSVDLVELSGGGRLYFNQSKSVLPFFSVWSVVSSLDGDDIPQVGVRLGGGAEFPLNETFALRFELDYLVPILGGEDSLGFEVEGSGLAGRFGFSALL